MMRRLAAGLALAALAAPAAAAVTISFGGSANGRSVTGFFNYDETQAPSSVMGDVSSQGAFYFPPNPPYSFYFASNGLVAYDGYRAVVGDAAPGNTSGATDGFGAFVQRGASGREQFSFVVDYGVATALSGLALPVAPPQGPAIFTYSFAGQGFSIPVTWFAQAGIVPEPRSWAILTIGFGVAGAALRRRPRGRLRAA